jgi:hypothetical protein
MILTFVFGLLFLSTIAHLQRMKSFKFLAFAKVQDWGKFIISFKMKIRIVALFQSV